jgi:NAD(P)-dependent dehydrogenase (short-subunit alcohol dehydrogenase family)
MGAYAVSKAGVLAFTEVLAKEGKPYHIQVNSILPSVIDTLANRRSMPNADFTKWVAPKEIANLLITLSRPETNALSETALRIFGRV